MVTNPEPPAYQTTALRTTEQSRLLEMLWRHLTRLLLHVSVRGCGGVVGRIPRFVRPSYDLPRTSCTLPTNIYLPLHVRTLQMNLKPLWRCRATAVRCITALSSKANPLLLVCRIAIIWKGLFFSLCLHWWSNDSILRNNTLISGHSG